MWLYTTHTHQTFLSVHSAFVVCMKKIYNMPMNETGKKAKPHDHGVEAFETGQNGLLLMTSTSIHDCDTMLHGIVLLA